MDTKKIFSERLNNLMLSNCKTRVDIATSLGIPYTTVTDWVKGKKIPRMDKVQLLANYFSVNISYFIDSEEEFEEKQTKKKIEEMSDEEAQFVLFYLSLSNEEKDKIKQLAEISGIGKK